MMIGMNARDIVLLVGGMLCAVIGGALLLFPAIAHNTPEFAQLTPDEQNWIGEAQTTTRSRGRLFREHGWSWPSCCNHGDRVKTHFRVNKDSGADEWWFLKKGDESKTDEWVRIPNDVIHTDEDAEDDAKMRNRMSPQLRTEGVLFIYNGVVTCFWPPAEGG